MAEKTLKVTAAQIEESVEKSHNHSNLSTLNNITSSRVSEWDDKADKEHRHNASEIDGLDNLDVNLSNYYTKTQVDNKIATEIDSIDLPSYAKKSEIPNATSDLTNDSNFATQSFVTSKIAEASLSGGNVDLSGYATKDELNTKANVSAIPTKTSQLTNDSNYLAAIPSEYITETELETELNNKVDKVSGYSLVSDVEIARLANVDNYDDTEVRGLIPTKVSNLTNDSNYLTSIPSEYVTETELTDKGYATITEVDQKIAEAVSGSTVDLSGYALKTEIPTDISQLNNDSNYLTSVPSEYITETELNTSLSNKVDKEAGKGLSTNDLTNEMVVKINNAATQAYVTNAIAEARLDGSDVDLSGLATKDELNEKAPLTHSHNISDVSDLQTALDSKVNAVSGKSLVSDTEIARLANVDNYDDSEIRGLIPTKVSQLLNDRNYLNSVPSEYITEDELNNKGYATTAEVDQKIANGTVDLSGYALKTEVPTKTSQLTNDSNYLTAIPEEYVTETELNNKKYATETFVSNKIAEASLSGEEVDLSGYATKDDLKTKANTSHTHVTSDVTDLDLSNIDATSLNGKKLSNLMTKDEYDAIDVKEPNTIYLVGDDTALEGIPSYSVSDAGKVLAVNSAGTGLVWVTLSSSGGGSEEPKTLNSISAVYTQGNIVIYPSTSLDSLKSNLVVTATYSDNSTSVISNGYSLSGNLTVGTSTITVTYSRKTTTFNVTVSEEITPTKNLTSITSVYTQGDTIVRPSTALNNLKSNLVVTANYDDDSTETVTDYTLSGILVEGTSTITVTYSGKTTTFDVTVSEETSTEMDSAYSYLRVTVPASATPEQSTLYLSKPTGGTMSSLYINDVSKDVPTGLNDKTTSYLLDEGENIVKIKGNFTCWGSKCNINVLQLQNDLTTCLGMFYECPNIVFNATIPSTVITTNSMFRYSGLVNGIDIPSSVTNTASMYQYDKSLKTAATVSDNVETCNNMYDGCSSLQGIVNVPNSATNITKYLNGAGKNGEGISVIGINTSFITNYAEAFYEAKVTTIEQSFADLIKQAKPEIVTNAKCFKVNNTTLKTPITIAEVHSDWKA